MKGFLVIPFLTNIFLGTLCPMQLAAATALPGEHHATSVAMSALHDTACPLAEKPTSVAFGTASKSPCSDGHCLSMETPETSAFLVYSFEKGGSVLRWFSPAVSSLLAFEILHPLPKITGDPLASHINTIVLRV